MSVPTPLSTFSPADAAAIAAVCPRAAECLESGDFEGYLTLAAEDIVFMPPNWPALEGKEALRSWMQSFPKITSARFVDVEIEGAGTFAWVRGEYFFTLQPEGAPSPIEDHGKYLSVYKRQPDGSWLVYRDIFNSDLAAQLRHN